MSLAIDIDRVDAVLLADGWHEVVDFSFALDAYEYVWYSGGRTRWDGSDREPVVFVMGDEAHGGYTGYSFREPDGRIVAGPCAAILAVRSVATAPARRRGAAPKARKRRPIPLRLRFTVLQRDGFRCVHCGARPDAADLQIDHVIPFSKGGADTEDNLVTSCAECNSGRGNSDLRVPVTA